MNTTQKSVIKIVSGTLFIAAGVLILLFLRDFTPRYIGASVIAVLGAILATSGILGLAQR